MDVRFLKTVVALIAVASLGLSGCSWFGGDPDPSPSPSEVSTVPSTSPSAATVAPKPAEPSQPTAPTVEDLEEHLDGIISSASGSGQLTCVGRGPLSTDDAIECSWLAAAYIGYPDGEIVPQREGPVYVVVLDDNGRYTFRSSAFHNGTGAVVGDYPPGTTDCRALMDPPPGSDHYLGLSYTSLLYYWITQGRPASMDDDGNGLPCETVYPARVVERTIASPLVPGNDSVTSHEVRDVVGHLEAVLSGVRAPGTARVIDDEARVLASPAVTGTRFTVWMDYDVGMQEGEVYVTVLEDSGRYAISSGHCCLTGPNPQDYGAGTTCKRLTQDPNRGKGKGWPEGLSYGNAVFYWRMHGSPELMDGDGDGKPCENVYPASDVSKYFGSTLEP
jgi:hypothetical protein